MPTASLLGVGAGPSPGPGPSPRGLHAWDAYACGAKCSSTYACGAMDGWEAYASGARAFDPAYACGASFLSMMSASTHSCPR